MKISVITATYNAMQHLPALAESLRAQADKDFEWVVADGSSTDGTLEYLKSITDLNVKVISQEDFGIYDALNRGIRACKGDFYIVMGADDVLYPNAVSLIRKALVSGSENDFFVFPVKYSERILEPKKKMSWLYGQFSYISMHSVGLVIRKDLHEKYGYYSRKFPIAADQYFILKAIRDGAKYKTCNELTGEHGSDGVSGTDHVGVITEFYRVQLLVGFNKYLQTLLVILRLLKNIKNIRVS
ncbi:glycosyltransferase [Ectopseudomonas oleovorans]|uniref:glycosyltransferase n=1 Tax=Ectopseudomonas oleovorans TaxID=301 RepID=UPI00241DF4DB|nr:glycosyltransferase [Pseudomonas oleovorans]